MTKDEPILFFDGVCGLCNRFVDFVLKWDTEKRFRFSPLQGETAQARGLGSSVDSMIVVAGAQIFRADDAFFYIIERISGPGCFLAWGKYLPSFLRHALYRFTAEHRYRLFGKRDTCRLPSPEEKGRFLP